MKCSVCGFDLSSPQTACPHCGSYLGNPLATRAADPPRTFRYLLAGSVFVLAVFGFLSYRLLSKPDFWDFLRNPALNQRPRQQAVVHGEVITPEELEAHGKLYFLPMGRQAVPVESLAAYYRDKFRIEVTVLPEVAIDSAAYDSPRGQYIAEEMILDMKRAQPGIARAADSIIIILTDEDIYPRSLGWKWTYSFHTGYKFAVVSSRRNDPAFWNSSKPHDAAEQLAGMKQMLTKYVAMLCFHLPPSFDPTSVMYQPLTPNGGSDDLYESDLHSEESANGFRGSGWPCLFYSYSYVTGAMRRLTPFVEECDHLPVPASPQEEIFETLLSSGEFFEFARDFQLDSVPSIEFRRSYRSQYPQRWSLGLGANQNYNTYLYSDGAAKLSFIDIITEDGSREHFVRVSSGIGFSPSVVFENRDSAQELYGARLTWDSNHFKLQYRDGSWSTFLPCEDGRCYWNGYQDASGHPLLFERDASLNLHRLTASDNQGIEFQSDSQFRLTQGTDTSGNRVSYEYDAPGRLVSVSHADGQVTLYFYDLAHRMTRMDVVRKPGESPETVFTNEYDARGRVTTQTLADGSVYRMEYTVGTGSQINHVKLIEPSGRVLEIACPSGDDYVVRANPVRFPAVPLSSRQGIQ
jgi:YD repeat-containing protein